MKYLFLTIMGLGFSFVFFVVVLPLLPFFLTLKMYDSIYLEVESIRARDLREQK